MELAGGTDGTTMYETKYFLNQEKKRSSLGDLPATLSKEGGAVVNVEELQHKNKRIKDRNVSDMLNIYRRENLASHYRHKPIEAVDPVKGDLKARKDPYEEYYKKRNQMIQNARLASQKMRNIKQLPKLSTKRAQNFHQNRESQGSGNEMSPREF